MVSECPCYEFHESPRYRWAGPNAALAEEIERTPALPGFFIFDGGSPNVLFDAPLDAVPGGGFRAWCRTGDVPDELAPLAAKAREDDSVALVFLDALLERGLARSAS